MITKGVWNRDWTNNFDHGEVENIVEIIIYQRKIFVSLISMNGRNDNEC